MNILCCRLSPSTCRSSWLASLETGYLAHSSIHISHQGEGGPHVTGAGVAAAIMVRGCSIITCLLFILVWTLFSSYKSFGSYHYRNSHAGPDLSVPGGGGVDGEEADQAHGGGGHGKGRPY